MVCASTGEGSQPSRPALRVVKPPQQRDGHRGRAERRRDRDADGDPASFAWPRRVPSSDHIASEQIESSIAWHRMGGGVDQKQKQAVSDVVRIVFAEVGFDFQPMLQRKLPREVQLTLRPSNLLAQSFGQSASGRKHS